MYDFDYQRPTSKEAAIEAHKASDDGMFLAGGQTMIPVLKQRLAMPSLVVDLGAIGDLAGIERSGDTIQIGAMTTHAAVAASDVVKDAIPALAVLAGVIGDPHVRNRGTIGGSVVNNDPAADYPAGLLGLGATVVTDRRQIAADDFFLGMFETALEEGELVTRIDFPVPEKAGYLKFENPASGYAIVGVMASTGPAGTRVAVTGAGPGVFRVEAMEQVLSQSFTADALDGITVPADGLNNDIHAAADYRAHLIGVIARRAVEAATGA
ncbi:MAG: xanthine dehydrogenase family protein subunit M [Rhodospirillales bacterium]|nr:xanthine dehydrogenase family protein subunit M [Rhodospirillales bacterium]